MLFLAGIPGQLASLLARLTNSTVPLTDARVTKIDNLDAAITTRAASSTALSNSVWTDPKAAFLDAAVTSVAFPVTSSINGGQATQDGLNGAPGTKVSAGTLTANTWATVVDITSGKGFLKFACAYRDTASWASGDLDMRVTIDGTVVITVDGSSSTTQNRGCVAVGFYDAAIAAFDQLRFKTSLKIEVRSSAGQTAAYAAVKYLYSTTAT